MNLRLHLPLGGTFSLSELPSLFILTQFLLFSLKILVSGRERGKRQQQYSGNFSWPWSPNNALALTLPSCLGLHAVLSRQEDVLTLFLQVCTQLTLGNLLPEIQNTVSKEESPRCPAWWMWQFSFLCCKWRSLELKNWVTDSKNQDLSHYWSWKWNTNLLNLDSKFNEVFLRPRNSPECSLVPTTLALPHGSPAL